MKILLAPDTLDNWAGHNRCKAIQKYLPEYEFEICPAPYNQSIFIPKCKDFDVIHWNFTCDLEPQYYDFVMKNAKKSVITIVNERSILLLQVNVSRFEEMIRACTSTSVGKKIASIYQIEYIPNGIDFDIFNNPKKIRVGYAGSKVSYKGYYELEHICNELGFTLDALFYADKKTRSHEQMQEWFKTLDVFIHPSHTEGCSNVVLEALACNVPVITTKTGIWEEFVGYVVFYDTLEELKMLLSTLDSRKLIMERFDWKQIVQKYKAVYERAYERSRS